MRIASKTVATVCAEVHNVVNVCRIWPFCKNAAAILHCLWENKPCRVWLIYLTAFHKAKSFRG